LAHPEEDIRQEDIPAVKPIEESAKVAKHVFELQHDPEPELDKSLQSPPKGKESATTNAKHNSPIHIQASTAEKIAEVQAELQYPHSTTPSEVKIKVVLPAHEEKHVHFTEPVKTTAPESKQEGMTKYLLAGGLAAIALVGYLYFKPKH
jgi:cobalamin biosynthesis Mg chelatase CobN